MHLEIIGANCRATGLPWRSSFSLTTSFSSRESPSHFTCGKPPFRIFRLDAQELPDILYGVHHLPSTLVVTSPNVLWMCWSHPYPVHTCPRFDSFHFIIFRSRRDVLGCTSFPLGCSRSSCLGIRGVLDAVAHSVRLF
jgi:hypothetical protein